MCAGEPELEAVFFIAKKLGARRTSGGRAPHRGPSCLGGGEERAGRKSVDQQLVCNSGRKGLDGWVGSIALRLILLNINMIRRLEGAT